MKIILFTLFIIFNLQFTIKSQISGFSKKALNDSNLVFVQSGKCLLGNNKGEADEKPARHIKLNSFLIGKYEVTNAEFVEFLNEKGNQSEENAIWINLDGNWKDLKCRIYQINDKFKVESGFEDFPVNYVSWYGANAYSRWRGGRLPSEAEWEYAAKGGKLQSRKTLKEIETNLGEYAWYSINSEDNLHKKGLKKGNILGIYDISGNLWEWCNDFYNPDYYKTRNKLNPPGPKNGDYKVIRGGSWTNNAEMLQISNRNGVLPASNKINIGFRIVFDIAK